MKSNFLISRIVTVSFVVCVALSGCSQLLVGPDETNDNLADFDSIGEIISNKYAFLRFKRINWDSLLATYRPLAEQAKGDEIYKILHSLLRELKDGHIELWTEGGFPTITYEWPRLHAGEDYNPLVVRNYFGRELRVAGDGNFEYEILPDNIGYVYLASFEEGNWVTDLSDILVYFSSTKGLIFDVRNNSGGKGGIADFITQRFTQTHITYSVYLPNDSTKGTLTINPGVRSTYHGRVVLLINGASFSAAELLPALMEQIPSVTTLGDTTGGGGGSNDVFYLPSNKRIKIPTSYFKRSNGEMIEWNGIPPDILVQQTEVDIIQGRDKQLEYAITLLK